MKKIKVTIDTLGNPTVEAEGFTGSSCVDATAAIEKALSGDPSGRVLKMEFHEQQDTLGEIHQSW